MVFADKQLADAIAHHGARRLAEAEVLYRQVLEVEPNNPDALHLLGVLAHQVGRNDLAIGFIGRAIGLREGVPEYYNNLGEALRGDEQYAAAIQCYRQALTLRPDYAEAHNNLGTVHQDHGRFDEALACYEQAIACRPSYSSPHYNRARVWLSQGKLGPGFAEYEWRWRRDEFIRRLVDAPEWDSSPLAGRTLLVQAEQGLGDTLQFIRYVPMLRESGGKIIVAVQPSLIPLLTDSRLDNLISQDAPLPACDVHTTLMSVPRLLGTVLETVPSPGAYLEARGERIAHWQARLSEVRGLKVGVHGQANLDSPSGRSRRIALSAFEPLARADGVRLVSLERNAEREPMQAVADELSIVDLGPEFDAGPDAFLDAAAVIASLDLVVTSDSAIAHLAGALGKRVWVALSVAADWRWMQSREDSPWYPTMRLFRQSRLGDWSDVMARLAAELAELARS